MFFQTHAPVAVVNAAAAGGSENWETATVATRRSVPRSLPAPAGTVDATASVVDVAASRRASVYHSGDAVLGSVPGFFIPDLNRCTRCTCGDVASGAARPAPCHTSRALPSLNKCGPVVVVRVLCRACSDRTSESVAKPRVAEQYRVRDRLVVLRFASPPAAVVVVSTLSVPPSPRRPSCVGARYRLRVCSLSCRRSEGTAQLWPVVHDGNWREAVFVALDDPTSSRAARYFAFLVMGAIVISVGAFLVQSYPQYRVQEEVKGQRLVWSFIIDTVCVSIFSIGTAACPRHRDGGAAHRMRVSPCVLSPCARVPALCRARSSCRVCRRFTVPAFHRPSRLRVVCCVPAFHPQSTSGAC
jgi:hypothetical protein